MLSNYFAEELQPSKSLASIIEDTRTELTTKNPTEVSENLVPKVLTLDLKDTNEVKLTGPAVEEWLNTVLKQEVQDESIPEKI
jgi:hypothetical protein